MNFYKVLIENQRGLLSGLRCIYTAGVASPSVNIFIQSHSLKDNLEPFFKLSVLGVHYKVTHTFAAAGLVSMRGLLVDTRH